MCLMSPFQLKLVNLVVCVKLQCKIRKGVLGKQKVLQFHSPSLLAFLSVGKDPGYPQITFLWTLQAHLTSVPSLTMCLQNIWTSCRSWLWRARLECKVLSFPGRLQMSLDLTWTSKARPLVLTAKYHIYPGDLVSDCWTYPSSVHEYRKWQSAIWASSKVGLMSLITSSLQLLKP